MEVLNLKKKGSQITELFRYKTIAKRNGHNSTLVRVKERTLDLHTHPDSDEFFLIVEGEMQLEFSSKMVELKTGDMCVVPKGTEHRPICTTEVTCLLIEKEGMLTAANTGGAYRGRSAQGPSGKNKHVHNRPAVP
ncbi:MAG: cupin domain-containing protein [Proteobacteria bacterium]|nr:cupin domain-containing protein [Pseudomonadota bacterium]MBU1138743.1 cupin domain-containing protein [Pseudomonadota bacterium]